MRDASKRRDIPCFVRSFRASSYPLHSHEMYEIELVTGENFHNIIDSVDHTVRGSACFFYLPYTKNFYYTADNSFTDIIRVGFSGKFIPDEYMDLMFARGPVMVDCSGGRSDEIRAIFDDMTSRYFGDCPDRLCEMILRADIMRLLAITSGMSGEADRRAVPDDTISRVTAYLRSNFTKPISIDDTAAVAGMSPDYFGRWWRRHTGENYSSYLASLRLNLAVSLVRYTSFSIKKISSNVGYLSESGFIKAFEKYYGVRPDTLRSGTDKHKTKEKERMNISLNKTPIPFPKTVASTGKTRKIDTPKIAAHSAYGKAAAVLAGYIKRYFDTNVSLSDDDACIVLDHDFSLEDEEYRITTRNGVTHVLSSTDKGASRGAAALLTSLGGDNGSLVILETEIYDKPDTIWRGMMLDLARGHYTVDDILAYADLCYIYRMNMLHLHFADGPSPDMYKLPSDRFPLLTSSSGYAKDDIRRIREYLSERGITLVPEIEVPAHCEALPTRYPELFGTHRGMICPGHKGVYESVHALIDEVCGLFPDSPYIHFGCDEARYEDWDDCAECREFMREKGLKSSAELYTYFAADTARYILSLGRTPVVWEGFGDERTSLLPKELIVMVYQSTYFDAKRLTDAGFRVVNTSWQPLYIVPSRPKFWRPEDIYNVKYNEWLLEDAVDNSEKIIVPDRKMVLGSELCVWESAEKAADFGITSRNLPALAERTWNYESPNGYQTFTERFRVLSGLI